MSFPGLRVFAALTVAVATAAGAACGGDDDEEPPGSGDGPAILVAVAENPGQPGAAGEGPRLIDLSRASEHEIGADGRVSHVAFSPDGRFLAAGYIESGGGSAVRVYEVASGDEVAADESAGPLTALDWTVDGERLAIVRPGGISVLTPNGEPVQIAGTGLEVGSNVLQWAWTRDGEHFGLLTPEGLVLIGVDGGEPETVLPREEFPADAEGWGLRTAGGDREIGLVDLTPVQGLPDARAEFPLTIEPDGTVTVGEPRLVSIYDWGRLPSPEFDAAVRSRFAPLATNCDPCRSADGGSSLMIAWLSESGRRPAGGDPWPDDSETYLALETGEGAATAANLEIDPEGAFDPARWMPVFDVVVLQRD